VTESTSFIERVASDPLGTLVAAAAEGDVVLLDGGDPGPPVFLVNHPSAIRSILVTDHGSFRKGLQLEALQADLGRGLITTEGSDHRHRRRAVQPSFTRSMLADAGASIERRTLAMCDTWSDGQQVDVEAAMSEIAVGVILEHLFGIDAAAVAPDIRAGLVHLDAAFERHGLPFSDLNLPAASPPTSADVGEGVRVIVRELVLRGITSGAAIADMSARLPTDAGLIQALVDESLGLLLAGHVTTASALSWAWLLLAGDEVASKDVLGEVDGDLRTATTAMFSEAMRLYPPAWGTHRRTLVPTKVDDVEIPAGALVVVSQYVVHRDPRWWRNPMVVDLERWTAEARAARPMFAYFPFGGGPRLCVGEQLAWLEGVVVLSTVSRRWQLHSAASGSAPSAVTTLRPPRGFTLTARQR